MLLSRGDLAGEPVQLSGLHVGPLLIGEKRGECYYGTRPPKKRITRLCRTVSDLIMRVLTWLDPGVVIGKFNWDDGSWSNYFCLGPETGLTVPWMATRGIGGASDYVRSMCARGGRSHASLPSTFTMNSDWYDFSTWQPASRERQRESLSECRMRASVRPVR